MDTHSHQTDFNALSKLYWLVQNNDPADGQSLITKVLDEGSGNFLRKLLDAAADKIYENMKKKSGQPEDHLEMLNRSHTSSPNRVSHKKVVGEKASKVKCPRVVNDALERIASFIPKLERLSKPYSNSRPSSPASSYGKTTSTAFSSDFNSSSTTQFGTSQSRTTSYSSFGSSFYHGDDELSPSEYYQSRQRSQKKMGKLSGSKDKLGSIFHHHHHHHHHHHRGQLPRDTSVEASKSLWKKNGKMFRSLEKRVEAKHEKKYTGIEKVEAKRQKRPTINRGKHEQRNRKQGGHFEAPVGGLMVNLKNSKKPKQCGQVNSCIKVSHKPGDKLQQRKKGLRLRQKD